MKLKSVNKKYGNQKVLDDINLSLSRGKITALIGKNGAGKTTIMKILCENIQRFEGTLSGKESQTVGYLIENPKAYMNESGLYNLRYFYQICSKNPDSEYISYLIDAFGMKDYINKKVKNYSMGMKQRLGMAMSMVNKPDYLILDEPTNGMDPDGSLEVLETLKNVSDQYNMGVLISSHKLEDIEKISDEVVFIKNGTVNKVFTTDELLNTGMIQISVDMNEIEKAFAIIQRLTEHVKTEGSELFVPLETNISNVIRDLSKQNIFPDNIKEVSHSLKDYYFQINEDGKEA